MHVEKIVSGGQTGVDRAALDVARSMDIPCGGWCPRGRASEDGPIADDYPLTETPSADPAQRTEWNVRDSDGTLIIAEPPLTGGTALTEKLAAAHGKPCLVIEPGDPAATETIPAWIGQHHIRTLNVAGPRESGAPGIYARAFAVIKAVLE